MIELPRGKPVKEGIDPSRMDWQEALKKLHDGRFTGYLNAVAEQGRGLLLFLQGRLALIRYGTAAGKLIGEEAMGRVLEDSLAGRSRLDIYRLETALAVAVYNLLEGVPLYRGQHCELLDLPHLIERLKGENFSGGLCLRAQGKAAVIFMHAGRFTGFFHDGEPGLATDADLAASVAWLPGARLDVVSAAAVAETDVPDLLQDVDLGGLCARTLQAR